LFSVKLEESEISDVAVAKNRSTSKSSASKKKSFKLKSGHYACQLCGKVLSYQKSLRDHVRFVHENERSYQCEQCPYAAAKRRDLDKHVDSVHDKSKPFKSEAAILRHNRKQAIGQDIHGTFRCDQCPFATTRRGNLTNHILTAHEYIRQYSCSHCEFSASRDDLLTKHVRTAHDRVEAFGCELCHFETTDRTLLTTHVSNEHASLLKQFMTLRDRISIFNCEMCSYECMLENDLIDHVRNTHYKVENGGLSYECPLKSHSKCVHDKILTFKCDRCSFQTNAQSKLDSHVYRSHSS